MKKKVYITFLIMVHMTCVLSGCSNDNEPKNHFYWIPKTPPVYSMDLPSSLEAVDLGLSVLWASCNFGASTPEDYGGYFAWGDPTGALWSNKGIGYDENGYTWDTDNYGGRKPKTEISATSLDVVTQHWGNGWRTPRLSEAVELCNMCEWKLMEDNGRKYYRVIGPNGNSIDMPLCGAYSDIWNYSNELPGQGPYFQNSTGYYWTSTVASLDVEDMGSLYETNPNVYRSFAFVCNSNYGDLTGLNKFMIHLRAFHLSIRPVHNK